MLPDCSKFLDQNVQIRGYVFHDTKIQWYLSNEICIDTHQQVFRVKDSLKKISLELGCEKVLNWEYVFVHRTQGLFLLAYVDAIKMAGMAVMWKNC